MAKRKVTKPSKATATNTASGQHENEAEMSPHQKRLLENGHLIHVTPEMEASIERIKEREAQKKKDRKNSPGKKEHRLITQRNPVPASDRVTRFGGSGRKNLQLHGVQEKRIKRINCRYKIPGTNNIEYWRNGVKMVCPPGYRPWEKKTATEVASR